MPDAATLAGCGVLWAKWLMWQATGRWDAYETPGGVLPVA